MLTTVFVVLGTTIDFAEVFRLYMPNVKTRRSLFTAWPLKAVVASPREHAPS
jgi:hypothetical protein